MSDLHWQGTIDGCLETDCNWYECAVPSSSDNVIFDTTYGTWVQQASSGSICVANVYNCNDTIAGGTFCVSSDVCVYSGAYMNGIYNAGTLYVDSGTINSGTYTLTYALCSYNSNSLICDGTFITPAANYDGCINCGTFCVDYFCVCSSLAVNDGVFCIANTWVMSASSTCVAGGCFYSPIEMNGGTNTTFTGGTFYSTVVDCGNICGGTYYGLVTLPDSYGLIAGGTFYKVDLQGTECCSSWCGAYSGLTQLKIDSSITFTKEKGINGSGILGLI